jgi:hypothetical protein
MEEAVRPDLDRSSDRIRVISSQNIADEPRINNNVRQDANLAKGVNVLGLWLLCRHKDDLDKNGKCAWESRE